MPRITSYGPTRLAIPVAAVAVVAVALIASSGGGRDARQLLTTDVVINPSVIHDHGQVRVVMSRSSFASGGAFRATITNRDSRTIYWGGCVYWDRWPGTAIPPGLCITGAAVEPGSSWPIGAKDFIGQPPIRHGRYRVMLVYETGSSVRAPVQYASASFRIR